MSEERRKILEMLSEGKISVDEAEKLMAAVGTAGSETANGNSCCGQPKYLRVLVEPGPNSETKDKVNVRVPLKLIRAGLKFAAFIPQNYHGDVNKALKDKGIDVDLSKITPEDLEEIVVNLNDLTVDVEGKEKVRVFCE